MPPHVLVMLSTDMERWKTGSRENMTPVVRNAPFPLSLSSCVPYRRNEGTVYLIKWQHDSTEEERIGRCMGLESIIRMCLWVGLGTKEVTGRIFDTLLVAEASKTVRTSF